MKKGIALLLALAMMLTMCTLAACNKDDEPAEPSQPEEQPEQQPDEQPDEENTEEPEQTPAEEEKQEEVTEMTLKIGSYNIANGSRVGHDLKKIADDILAMDLDIVGLQEVDKFASRSQYLDTMKKLSELTGYEYYYYTVAINIGGDEAKYGQPGEYGTGILSRYPITSGEDYKLNSQGHEQRMLGHATIEVAGKTIHFFNTHLSWENDSVRAGQFKQIDQITGEYDYVILTGDFNQRSLEEGQSFSYLYPTNSEDNPLETYKGTDWNTLCIDNILYTQEFKLIDSKVVDNNHSDHCLLVAVLELKLK